MATILITGGSGLVGRELSSFLLAQGYDVVWLSRKAGETRIAGKTIPILAWNPQKGTINDRAIEQADHIINLAGAGVADKRWTARRKQEIVESRVKSGQLLAAALTRIPHKVKTFIQPSAIGWYGPDTVDSQTKGGFLESDPCFPDFLGETCKAWEESIDGIQAMGIRVVIYRMGIVLSRQGGAYQEFSKPLRMGVATIMGSGKQMVSWIHVQDLCRLFLYAIENPSLTGIFNAVAPTPVSNEMLVRTIAQNLRERYLAIKLPTWLLQLVLGEMSIEVLKSATVSSANIQKAGFDFLYPNIHTALR